MSVHINQAVRLKSFVFWQDRMKQLDQLAMVKRHWDRKDYKGYMDAVRNDCVFCRNGEKTRDPKIDGQPLYIKGMLIDRINCYCMTLEYLSKTASRWYESTYLDRYLDDYKVIDNPKGSAKDTEKLINGLRWFVTNPTRSALIHGRTGTGKTHMLQSIKTALGGFAVYTTMADFRSKVINLYVDKTEENRLGEFMDKLTWAPVLLLDDFGSEKQTDYSMDMLWQIIDSRYGRRRYAPTIITTNMSLTDINTAISGGTIGNLERILSRMLDTDNSSRLEVKQADYRLKGTKVDAGMKVKDPFFEEA